MAEPEPLVCVECYSGYKGDERPVRVFFRGQMVEVNFVEDRWYSPGFTFFRVFLSTGEHYVLRHQEAQEVWSIEAFRGASAYIDTKINGGV